LTLKDPHISEVARVVSLLKVIRIREYIYYEGHVVWEKLILLEVCIFDIRFGSNLVGWKARRIFSRLGLVR